MATTKRPTSKAKAPTRTTAAKGPQRFKIGTSDPAAKKAISAAIDRALKAQQLPPGTRFPIFCGIFLNPITKEFEIINQIEDIQG